MVMSGKSFVRSLLAPKPVTTMTDFRQPRLAIMHLGTPIQVKRHRSFDDRCTKRPVAQYLNGRTAFACQKILAASCVCSLIS